MKQDWYQTIYSDDNPKTPAYGWIQWKGTDVCIDLHCICGSHGHFDGDFMYYVECEDCGRKYAVGQNIKLIPLDNKERIEASKHHGASFCKFGENI
jgi:hypothetical protein